MSLLTDQEIKALIASEESEFRLARAIEAAVIKKLATVSVEPAYTTAKNGRLYTYPDEVDQTGLEIDVFTATQLAAARVQALEEAEKLFDQPHQEYFGAEIQEAIRELGGLK